MLVSLAATAAIAATPYPARPIRILIPFPPGGSTDLLARMVGQRFADAWGQPTVPDNRIGANGIIASDITAKAAPDGHTLLMIAIGHAANMSLYRKLPYDTLKDFTPLIAVADVPIFLAVHPLVKAASVKELVALMKAKPGAINCASGGVGASHHLAGELFRQMTGTEFLHIQYKGGGPALIGLVAGNVDMMFTPVSSAIQHVKSNRLRALAVTSSQRVALTPDLPTIAEAGVAGYEVNSWSALFAPAGTPAAVVTRLNAEIAKGLRAADTLAFLEKMGLEQNAGTPENLAGMIRSEVAKWTEAIRVAGIKPQ